MTEREHTAKQAFDRKVVVRPTNFRLPPHLQDVTSLSIQEVYATLAGDEERNQLIVADVIAAVQAKRFPVLLTERREHLDVLVRLLTPQLQGVIVMTGGMGEKQRKRVAEQIASMPAERPRVIVATGRYLRRFAETLSIVA